MQVKDIMSSDLLSCTPEMSLQEAAKLMISGDCGSIPVVDATDSTRLLGIITDRDMACRAVAEGKNPQDTKVADCMTMDVETIPADAAVGECCDIMEKAHVRRLLVTDREGRLCGIVAQADIALNLPELKTAEVVAELSHPRETC